MAQEKSVRLKRRLGHRPYHCGKIGSANGPATLPAEFTMSADEVIIVAEVCVRQDDKLLYQHHILPTREDGVPTAPA